MGIGAFSSQPPPSTLRSSASTELRAGQQSESPQPPTAKITLPTAAASWVARGVLSEATSTQAAAPWLRHSTLARRLSEPSQPPMAHIVSLVDATAWYMRAVPRLGMADQPAPGLAVSRHSHESR